MKQLPQIFDRPLLVKDHPAACQPCIESDQPRKDPEVRAYDYQVRLELLEQSPV
jgi:hypothetical protein